MAVVCEGAQLTYQELNRRANQVAHHLRGLGVGPEVLVGLCLERSLEMVVGLLGILKAGGAYVPLDPTYPLERLAFMLADAQVSVLLTQERLVARLPAHGAAVICLDSEWPTIARHRDENPAVGSRLRTWPRCCIRQAPRGGPKGSSGRIAPRSMSWPGCGRHIRSPLGRWRCQKTSMSFVDSILELLGPLLRGIQTIVIPNEVLQDPHRLVQTLAAHRVTRILLVPSLLRVLLDTHADLQRRLPSLDAVVHRWGSPPARTLASAFRSACRQSPDQPLWRVGRCRRCYLVRYRVMRQELGACPSAAPLPIPRSMCSTVICSLCLSVCPVSSTSGASVWPGAISTGPS